MADIQNNSKTLSVLLIQYNSSIDAIFGKSDKEQQTVTCLFAVTVTTFTDLTFASSLSSR